MTHMMMTERIETIWTKRMYCKTYLLFQILLIDPESQPMILNGIEVLWLSMTINKLFFLFTNIFENM